MAEFTNVVEPLQPHHSMGDDWPILSIGPKVGLIGAAILEVSRRVLVNHVRQGADEQIQIAIDCVRHRRRDAAILRLGLSFP